MDPHNIGMAGVGVAHLWRLRRHDRHAVDVLGVLTGSGAGQIGAGHTADDIKCFAPPDGQAEWRKMGGFSCLNAVTHAADFPASQPDAQTFLDSTAIANDFWAEPSYATLLQDSQSRFHGYIVAGEGTAQEALDGFVADRTEAFEDDGKL